MFKKASFQKISFSMLVVFILISLTTNGAILAQSDQAPAAPQNFNNHACSDLIIGEPGEGYYALPVDIPQYGTIHLMWSSSDHHGLYEGGSQRWFQGSPTDGDPILETMESNDQFGDVLAAGDFNNDTYYDVAIGVQHEDQGADTQVGGVNVLYGNYNGFSSGDNEWWDQNSLNVDGARETNDQFGNALAVGDFNGNGYDDLAIGAPGEAIGDQTSAGFVNILWGKVDGLGGIATGDTTWSFSQDSAGFVDLAEENDRFGDALAAGDFNGDGNDDLAIGSPGETIDSATSAGMVHVVYGKRTSGFDSPATQGFTEAAFGGLSETGDYFGSALATGDFNRDGYDDLAIGIYLEDKNTLTNSGAVAILYGSASGLTSTASDYYWQDQLFDTAEADDFFGFSLASGDFNGDGTADLVVSAPKEDVNGIADSGSVGIIFGSHNGLTTTGAIFLTQPLLSMINGEEDSFGTSLAVGDFNCDLIDDLAIGIPYDDAGGIESVGTVIELHGGSTGMVMDTWWRESDLGGTDEEDDWFGFAMVSAPINWHRVFAPLLRK